MRLVFSSRASPRAQRFRRSHERQLSRYRNRAPHYSHTHLSLAFDYLARSSSFLATAPVEDLSTYNQEGYECSEGVAYEACLPSLLTPT